MDDNAVLTQQQIDDFPTWVAQHPSKEQNAGLTQKQIDDFPKWVKRHKSLQYKFSHSSAIKAIEAGLAQSASSAAHMIDSLAKHDPDLHKITSKISKNLKIESDKKNEQFQNSYPGMASNAIKDVTSVAGGFAISSLAEAAADTVGPEAAGGALLYSLLKATHFVGKKALSGEAFGRATAGVDENQATAGNVGALINTAIGSTAHILSKTIQELSYSGIVNKFTKAAKDSGISKKQIKDAIKSAGNGPILAGRALENKTITHNELNFLPNAPFVKKRAIGKLNNISTRLKKNAFNLHKSLTVKLGKDERSAELVKNLKKHTSAMEKQQTELYSKANDLAKDLKLKFNTSNLKSEADKALKQFSKVYKDTGIESNGELISSLKSILKKKQEIKSKSPKSPAINRALGIKKKIKPNMKKETERQTDLQTLNYAKSALGDLAFSSRLSGNMGLAKGYTILLNAVKKDIQDGLSKDGAGKVNELYEKAEEFHKNEIVPLRDNGLTAISTGKKDADTITSTFLPQGNKQRLSLLRKFTKNAPKSEKLLLTDFLSPAIEEDASGNEHINPAKLRSLLVKLGPDRIKILLSGQRGKLGLVNKFLSDMHTNSEALQIAENPKTGYSTLSNTNTIEGAKLATSILGNVLGLQPMEAIGKLIFPAYTVNLSKALDNPEFLNDISNRLSGASPLKSGAATIANKGGDLASKLLVAMLNSNS